MLAQKTNNTLSERPIFIRVGLLLFLARPLTLSQMWELGEVVEGMDDLELEEKFNPFAKVLSRYKDFKMCEKVFLITLFRSRWKRVFWGWYIRKHLTNDTYSKLLRFATESFNAGFFLTNLTFLKGIKTMTSKTNTDEATAHGDLSEE